MAARSIDSGMLVLGLVAIPVKFYTAQAAKSVSFNMLHLGCNSRLKQQLFCPVDNVVVERADTVRGFEYAPDQYAVFPDEELKALESAQSGRIVIAEVVPEVTLDPLVVEKSYYLGPNKGGDRVFELLRRTLFNCRAAAVGAHAKRGKDALVALRAKPNGIVLHECLYANEVRTMTDIERATAFDYRDEEMELAEALLGKMKRDSFDASRFHDSWAKRVAEAVERKVAGEDFVPPETLPAVQTLDLEEALRESIAALKGTHGSSAPKARRKPERRARP